MFCNEVDSPSSDWVLYGFSPIASDCDTRLIDLPSDEFTNAPSALSGSGMRA